MHRRQDSRRPVDHRGHVTDEGFVEEGFDHGPVVASAFGVPLEGGPGGHGEFAGLGRAIHVASMVADWSNRKYHFE
jgi:hypothetical protein